MVFFDWDKYNLTAEAKRIVGLAADEFKRSGQVRVVVTGYTDTSGTASYNLRLSERRADSVKQEMIRQGVPASSIVTIGKGETDLLVPTADGVREPQNRRAVIEFPTPKPVVAAPPPPPPAPPPPKVVWGCTKGGWDVRGGFSPGLYGHDVDTKSWGGTLDGAYCVTDLLHVGLRQSLFADRFYGSSRAYVEYEFKATEQFRPYIGAILGGVYGDAVAHQHASGFGVGPSVGLKYYAWPKTYFFTGADLMFVVTSMGDVKNNLNLVPMAGLGMNF